MGATKKTGDDLEPLGHTASYDCVFVFLRGVKYSICYNLFTGNFCLKRRRARTAYGCVGSFNNRNWNTSNCCDVSFERPFITSHPRARSYASRERKLWWKKFKIKRFASDCDEIWDSRSIEGKEKLSTDPLTAILASLDHLYGIYGASSWNGRLQSPNLLIFLTVGYNLIS